MSDIAYKENSASKHDKIDGTCYVLFRLAVHYLVFIYFISLFIESMICF